MPDEQKSIRLKSAIVIAGIASFFIASQIFFIWLPKMGVASNVSAIIGLIAGAFVSYIVLTVFGIVKEFSLKGASFEFSSKLEEVKTDVKETKREVASGLSSIGNTIQSINTRMDTVITNQFSNINRSDQKVDLHVYNSSIKGAQDKVTKIVSDVTGLSQSLPVSGPKAKPTDDQLSNLRKSIINSATDILKNLSTIPIDTSVKIDSELKNAYLLITQAKYYEALKIYDSILTIDPQNEEAYLMKGICYYHLARRENTSKLDEESIKCYDKVLEIDSTNIRALHMKGLAYYYLGDMDKANYYYDKVLKIEPRYGVSLYCKACNLARMGNTKEALNYLKKAVAADDRFKQWAYRDAAFESMRNDPEFEKIVKFDLMES